MSDLGPEAREILRQGRDGDDPSPADRARIRTALMATIAAGVVETAALSQAQAGAVVSSAKPLATSWLASVWFKGMLMAFVGMTGVGALVLSSRATAERPPVQMPVVEQPKAADPVLDVPPAPLVPVAEVPAEKPVDAPVTPLSNATPQRPTQSKPAASVVAPWEKDETADSLVAETQRLRDAHGALQGGDPEKALVLLSEQAAESEGQKLREERAAARVIALCKLGRVDEANKEAAIFLEQNPRSPLAARVKKACPSNR